MPCCQTAKLELEQQINNENAVGPEVDSQGLCLLKDFKEAFERPLKGV